MTASLNRELPGQRGGPACGFAQETLLPRGFAVEMKRGLSSHPGPGALRAMDRGGARLMPRFSRHFSVWSNAVKVWILAFLFSLPLIVFLALIFLIVNEKPYWRPRAFDVLARIAMIISLIALMTVLPTFFLGASAIYMARLPTVGLAHALSALFVGCAALSICYFFELIDADLNDQFDADLVYSPSRLFAALLVHILVFVAALRISSRAAIPVNCAGV